MKSRDYTKINGLEEKYKEAIISNDYKKAEKIIRSLREYFPEKTEYTYMYACLLLDSPSKDENEKRRKLNRAEVMLVKKNNNHDDKSGDISLKLAEVYIEEKKYEEAIDVIENSFYRYKKEKKLALAYYYLGLLHDLKNNQENAIKYYKESIKRRDMGGCYNRLMHLLSRKKGYKESRECFEMAKKSTENMPRLYLDDAKFLAKMLKIDNAKIEFSIALAEDFTDPNLKEIEELIIKGKKKEAQNILKNMLGEKNSQFATLLLALLYIEQKQNYEAKLLLAKINKNPLSEAVFTEIMVMSNIIKDKYLFEIISEFNQEGLKGNQTAKYSNIKKLRYDGKYEEALVALENLSETEKKSAHIIFEKGKILGEMMRSDEAEKTFMSLLETKLRNIALTSLCDLYIYIGEMKKARTIIEAYENKNELITQTTELLIYEGKVEEAKKRVKLCSSQIDKEDLYEARLIIAIREENYESAKYYFELYKEKELIFKNKSRRKLDDLEFFINYKLNKAVTPQTYYQRQLVNYQKNDVIKHIGLHFKENEYKNQHSMFDKTLTPEEIYQLTKERLNKKSLHITDKATDIYIIDLKRPIARANNSETTCVRVITIANTDKILTIHPIWRLDSDVLINEQETGRQRVRK